MFRRSTKILLAVAGCLAPACAWGQATTDNPGAAAASPGQPGTVVQEVAPSNSLGLHGAFTNTITTSYITRGVLLENQGAIYQNVGELYFTLDDAPKITGIVGMFNSVHSEHTGGGSVSGATLDSTVEDWFEFDLWAGVSIDVTDKMNISAVYQEFHSPNDAFGVCKNVQVKVGYNDTDWWGKGGFALHQYALMFD